MLLKVNIFENTWNDVQNIWSKEMGDGWTWGGGAWTWLQSWCGRAGSAESKSTCTKCWPVFVYIYILSSLFLTWWVGSKSTCTNKRLNLYQILSILLWEVMELVICHLSTMGGKVIRWLWKHLPRVKLGLECVGSGFKIIKTLLNLKMCVWKYQE